MSENLFEKKTEVKVKEVVDTFLNYFVENQHYKIKGSSLVPENDPTLLFINSGMAPMKDYFLGLRQPPQPRLTNVQGCIRTKDIEEVGDRHHLTFFEMMGSWSIGDYWKKEAVFFAFELLTKGFGFPVNKLWASYYSGDVKKGIPADEESKQFWMDAGMDPSHIVPFGKDNFWGPAGKYGPCGPCTEVYFDTGSEFGPDFVPGGDFDVSDRYIEIWNAGVFMQYDLQPSGFEPLKIKSVDTGSGLERMVMALNGQNSCYEIDNMRTIREKAVALLNGKEPEGVPEMLSDHVRAAVYIMAEGVTPGNTGRGYIARRLIRRCLAALAQVTDTDDFSLQSVVDEVFAQGADWNPLPEGSHARVWHMFEEEQEAFKKVLRWGLQKLESSMPPGSNPLLSGEEAFNLVATYGLPIDTIRDFVEARGGKVDLDAFEKAFDAHREVSRQGRGQSKIVDYLTDFPPSVFEGLESLNGKGKALVLMVNEKKVNKLTKGKAEVVCDTSVFYPQSGGQIGDKGILSGANGVMKVLDTQKTGTGHIVHIGEILSGEIVQGELVKMEVDAILRANNAKHHSATHLLNAALQDILGDHIGQKGSLVEAEKLRFDFTHGASIRADEQIAIQNKVNSYIKLGAPRIAEVVAYNDAIKAGATAMFSDKYGDEVRVVSFGEYSKELCGGTHVGNASEIGMFLLSGEGSSSRGVRRITGVAGDAAFEKLAIELEALKRIKNAIESASDLEAKFAKVIKAITKILLTLNLESIGQSILEKEIPGELGKFSEGLREIAGLLGTSSEKLEAIFDAKLKKAIEKGAKKTAVLDTEELKTEIKTLSDGSAYIVAVVDADVPTMRDKGMELAEQIQGVVCFMTDEDRPKIVIALDKGRLGIMNARDVMNAIGSLIGAKGGGKPHLVAGGGSKAAGIALVKEEFETRINALL